MTAMPRRRILVPILALLAAAGCDSAETPETADTMADADTASATAPAASELPAVRITEPADGATLPGDSVRVVLAAERVAILPAGDTTPGSGHHHLLLNVEAPAEGEAIPAGMDGFVHLGQAQTEHVFTALPPGDYTLIAVIGDLVHRVLPQTADTVRFTVSGGGN